VINGRINVLSFAVAILWFHFWQYYPSTDSCFQPGLFATIISFEPGLNATEPGLNATSLQSSVSTRINCK
jgi:hypothetical protein